MSNVPTYPNVPSVNSVEQLIPPGPPLTSLRVILFLYSPIAMASGSPSLWYALPITQSRVPLAGVIVIIIDIIVQMVSLITRRRLFCPPPGFEGMPDSINMNLSDLGELLKTLKNKCIEPVKANETSQIADGGTSQMVAPEFLTLYLFVTGFIGPDPESPRTSFFLPIINFKGITGGLPIIIIGLISTILIRQSVPPTASGIEPIPEQPKEEPKFELKLPDILNLLKRFGGSFNYNYPAGPRY